jgi:hypothetical protein
MGHTIRRSTASQRSTHGRHRSGHDGCHGSGGVEGIIEGIFLDGGHYTVNAGGSTNVKMTYRNNTWGSNARYGSKKSTGGGVIWDRTNVYLGFSPATKTSKLTLAGCAPGKQV